MFEKRYRRALKGPFPILAAAVGLVVLLSLLSARDQPSAWTGPAPAADVRVSAQPSGAYVAVPLAQTEAITAYMPLAFRAYRKFINGSFDQGLMGWTVGRGPFNGHGSGLDQSVISVPAGPRALLGQAGELVNGTLPVGYGYIAQSFSVEERYLHLHYWVRSYDIAKPDDYFDTFEVSLNRHPEEILNAERDAIGCADPTRALNPTGTLVMSTDGLVFCAGRPGTSGGTLFSTDAQARLDLQDFVGQNITIYFTLWSREYTAPAYNDQGWLNTWVYIDDVRPSAAQ